MHALWRSNAEAVQMLLDAGADANVGFKGMPPLAYAVTSHMTEAAELLLKHGADVNFTYGGTHQSLLHTAVVHNNEGLVSVLLRHGADVNLADEAKMTPLMHCVDVEAPTGFARVGPMVQQLVSHKADLNACDAQGRTALWMLTRTICECLITKPKNLDTNLAPKIQMLKLFLGNRADPNKCDVHGNTPLHQLVKGECTLNHSKVGEAGIAKVVRVLLEHGADAHATNDDGFSSMRYAAKNKNLEAVRAMVDRDEATNTPGHRR